MKRNDQKPALRIIGKLLDNKIIQRQFIVVIIICFKKHALYIFIKSDCNRTIQCEGVFDF
ncbi:hypothetical protein D8T54_23435 [Vibrio vulnificus]|nr:hypothetical protein D8T54_23435 [Vibrio vulnificus]